MVQKPPTQNDDPRSDAAVVDAYERRKAGASPADVPTEWRAEVEDFVRLHRRLQAEPLTDVAPSVRAVILAAAAEATREPMREPLFTRLLHLMMRPGPVLAAMTLAALVVAVGVRVDRQAAAPPLSQAVASADREVEPPTLRAMPLEPLDDRQAPAMPGAAAAPPPVAVPNEAQAAPAGEATVQAKAPTAQEQMAKPGRLIAAQPASLGPAPDQPAEEKKQAAEGQWAQPPPAPLLKAAEAKGKAKAMPAKDDLANLDDLQADADSEKRRNVAPEQNNRLQYRNSGAPQALAEATPEPATAQAAAPTKVPVAMPQRAKEVQAEFSAADKRTQRAEKQELADKAGYAGKNADEQDRAASAAPAAPKPVEASDLRARVEQASDPEERVTLLQKLVVAARKSGDSKTEKWAMLQLESTQQAIARNRSQQQRQSEQKQAPAGKVKASAPASDDKK